MDEDEIAFQQKKKAEEAALKAAKDKGEHVYDFKILTFSYTDIILHLQL